DRSAGGDSPDASTAYPHAGEPFFGGMVGPGVRPDREPRAGRRVARALGRAPRARRRGGPRPRGVRAPAVPHRPRPDDLPAHLRAAPTAPAPHPGGRPGDDAAGGRGGARAPRRLRAEPPLAPGGPGAPVDGGELRSTRRLRRRRVDG